ncbi:MAG TPA: UBP-type zinc finger domain-containing protein [Solirubrobacteraceae bacterium]|nr:UBP-type zinc finger domain-containing protein [Solirubrobacteraceae bacterium]
MAECTHTDQMVVERPDHVEGCEECLATGSTWVELRVCRTCGHVGCCDSSPGAHATKHFKQTGHPIMSSAMPGATWSYCYVDEAMVS